MCCNTVRTAIVLVRGTLLSLALLSISSGCATHSTAAPPGVFVVAVAGERVFIGTAYLEGHTGTFEIKSIYNPPIDCDGSFNQGVFSRGRATFQCNTEDYGAALLRRDNSLRLSGPGQSTLGAVHIAFGYSLEELNERLPLPNNQLLERTASGFRLTAKGQAKVNE